MEGPLVEGDLGEGAFGLTLLLRLAPAGGAAYLHDVLRRLAGGAASVPLDGNPLVVLDPAVPSMTLRAVPAVRGAQRLFRDPDGSILWVGTTEEWETAALLVQPLVTQRGHQYLTSEAGDDVLVEVSNEWGD